MKRTWVCALVCWSSSLAAQTLSPQDAAAWRADLRVLARALPARHPAPFIKITAAQWDSAVASIDRRIPALSRNRMLVELLRLVALVGDAHTSLQPDASLTQRYYPLELYSFEDGVYVRRADSANAALVGAKLLRIGRASADEAFAAAGTVIAHENEWWVRAWAPFWLAIPEVLDGLGLVTDMERLPLVVERNGHVDTVVVAPTGRFAAAHGHGPAPIDMRGWVSMRDSAPPLWEQRAELPFWWAYLPESRTVYVSARAVVPAPHSNTNQGEWDQIFALVDTAPFARLVLDLRENLGGNGGLNRYPVQQILRRPTLDQPDRMFVIIGRRTFSAGQQFTNLLEAWTRATLVGEPTGQQTSQYGDSRPLALPNSHLTVQISTILHQAPDAFDRRAFVAPPIYTPLTSAEYRRGQDPALAAILSTSGALSVADAVGRSVAAGDTAGAERALRDGQSAVRNRYRNLEGDINALGYRLLGAGAVDRAIVVLALNTRVYAGSANTFDSLGEALLAGGRRDEAVVAYRHAVELDPGFRSSIEALRRLGVR